MFYVLFYIIAQTFVDRIFDTPDLNECDVIY